VSNKVASMALMKTTNLTKISVLKNNKVTGESNKSAAECNKIHTPN
jgi:hypothetical protein